jgi:hypothetical protein
MIRILILALALAACAPPPAHHRPMPNIVAAASEQRPYSCRLLDDERGTCWQ